MTVSIYGFAGVNIEIIINITSNFYSLGIFIFRI